MCLVAIFALLRVERRAVWLVVLLLVAPGLVVLGAWATLGEQWPEVLAGAGIAAVVAGGWWVLVGRRLPRQSSDAITVWGQEKAAKPKPGEVAAMQAELLRLKEENERLAAELKQSKPGNGREPGPEG